MKKISKFFALATVMLAFTAGAFAQLSATASANATIITPISIVKVTNADLNFGNVSVSPTLGGTVVILPGGGRSATSGVTLPAVTGTIGAASFTVSGEGTSTYAITLPTSDVTLNGTPSGTMTVNTFTSNPSGTGALTGGTQTLNVGGTLNVSAAQAAGSYTGTFNVSVNYN